MNEDFLTSQKASNALSKMRVTACTLEELELTQEQMDELIAATGNINFNKYNKTYYITKFNENNYEIISFINPEKVTERWLELSDLYLGSTFCDMDTLEYVLNLARKEGITNVHIAGDLYVNGVSHVVDEETIETPSNEIMLRQNATTGLANTEISGILVNKQRIIII